MKRATALTIAIAAYWLIRLLAAPAPEAMPSTIDELQAMEADQFTQQADWGTILEQHAELDVE